MTAPNHALTGAVIGLTVGNPWLAVPLAVLSHLVCDAIPHYDQPEPLAVDRIKSRRFLYEYIYLGALLCALLVLVLFLARPHDWLLAAVCAFLATSPDLLWIPRFIHVKRTGKDVPLHGWFWFHDRIQWRTGPRWWWVEAVWAAIFSGLVLMLLW